MRTDENRLGRMRMRMKMGMRMRMRMRIIIIAASKSWLWSLSRPPVYWPRFQCQILKIGNMNSMDVWYRHSVNVYYRCVDPLTLECPLILRGAAYHNYQRWLGPCNASKQGIQHLPTRFGTCFTCSMVGKRAWQRAAAKKEERPPPKMIPKPDFSQRPCWEWTVAFEHKMKNR